MKKLLLILALSISTAHADEYRVQADQIKYIYDGDTFFIKCKYCEKGKLGVRVKGVDTPEIRGKCHKEKVLARKAKQFAVEAIRNAQTIDLVVNDKRMYDRYNRLLANVLIDNKDLGKSLIDANLGREYHGRKRKSWCK